MISLRPAWCSTHDLRSGDVVRLRTDRTKKGLIIDGLVQLEEWVARVDQLWLVLWDTGGVDKVRDGELEHVDESR